MTEYQKQKEIRRLALIINAHLVFFRILKG